MAALLTESGGSLLLETGGKLLNSPPLPTPAPVPAGPVLPYSLLDFTRRLTSLLPQSWFADTALLTGGNTYELMRTAANPLTFVKTQIDYATKQARLLSSTDTNIEAIGNDFFGAGYIRGNILTGTTISPEADASFSKRLSYDVVGPKNTLAAIQTRVQTYLNQFYQATVALNSSLLGLDSAGGLDTIGATDGRSNNVPVLPVVYAFDIQSNPKLATKVGLTAGQFCLLFQYGGLQKQGFFVGRSYLGREGAPTNRAVGGGTFLLSPTMKVLPGALTPAMAALVNSIKATGFQPVYADNRV